MARNSDIDLGSLIDTIADRFAQSFAASMTRALGGAAPARVRLAAASTAAPPAAKVARKGRSVGTCWYPGCTNTAAPRYGMFCAALHKDLPKKEKEKYKAART